MYQGESLSINIRCSSTPAIDLNTADEIVIRFLNNKKSFTDDLKLSDGGVTIDPDESDLCHCILPREESQKLKPGELLVEMLLKLSDPDFPTGYFRAAQFIVEVETAYTNNVV